MSNPKFIESLKLVGERFSNIELHQQRIDLTSKMFSINSKIELKDIKSPILMMIWLENAGLFILRMIFLLVFLNTNKGRLRT